MKFSTTPVNLKPALSTVSKIVPSKASIPILSGILFEAAGDKLTLSATDLEQSIKGSVDGIEILEPGRTVIPKQFLPILNKLPNVPIMVEVNNNKLTVEYNKNTFSLSCMDAEEFPAIQEFEGIEYTLDFNPKKVSFAASKDINRPIFMVAHFNLEAGEIVATDTHKMAIQKTKAVPGAGQYNVPASFIEKLPVGTVMKFGNNQVAAYFEDYVYTSRLLSGTYPNYKAVISKDFVTKVKVKTSELLDTLERVSLIANSGLERQVVKINISGMMITVSTITETGNIQEFVAAFIEGDDLTINFAPALLVDALKCVDGNSEVTIDLGGPLSPATIQPGEEWQCIVLPVRVSE